METMENNIPSATHQEKAKKMKKLRRWQIAVSFLGVAIIDLGGNRSGLPFSEL